MTVDSLYYARELGSWELGLHLILDVITIYVSLERLLLHERTRLLKCSMSALKVDACVGAYVVRVEY